MIRYIFAIKSYILYFLFSFSILVILFFQLRKHLVFSIYGLYRFQHYKQYVGEGISALMSISDGLGPSISVESWKRRVLWGKRWMEKLFISRQSRHFHSGVVIYKVLFPIWTLTWRLNNYVSRQEKVKIGGIKLQI